MWRAGAVMAASLAVLGCSGADAEPTASPPTSTTGPSSVPTTGPSAVPTTAPAPVSTTAPPVDTTAPPPVSTTAPPVSTTAPPPVSTTVPAPIPTVPSKSGEPRLLTGLVADVAPGGVTLRWSVDESRAHRITGFSCVFRSPGHIELEVSGALDCPTGKPLGPDARSATLTGLPEFGDYDFEMVAQLAAGTGDPVYWGERALRLRVAVTEALAGPAGPAQAVSDTGPVVTGCGPGDGPGVATDDRPWQLGQIVSDTHLTHYPGRGWSAGGDPHTPPDWPEPRPLAELLDEAGLDGDIVDQAAEGTSEEQAAAAAALLTDEGGAATVALISARTKALLRPGIDAGWELRLHSGYPFGADYIYEPAHAVAGWGDPAHPTVWPALYERTDCPPPSQPDATHDVTLALSHDAAGGLLAHSGYGWWAVAPVGLFPERIVATQGGLSWGDPAAETPAAGARWEGRLSGHLLWDRRRFAVAGHASFELVRQGGELHLVGRIEEVVLSSLDLESLAPGDGPPLPWRTLRLDIPAAAAGDATPAAWSGAVRVDPAAPDGSPAMPGPGAFAGDWQAAAYGPGAVEIAGRLRLWTPLADGADPLTEWPAQAVLVAGFGAERTP